MPLVKPLLTCMLFAAAHVHAADFMADPQAACAWFATEGLKAQIQWSRPQPQGAWFCQHADEYSGNTKWVRGANAYVDPASGQLGVGLSIQTIGGDPPTHLEASEQLGRYVQAFYAAQGKPVPADVTALVGSKAVEQRSIDGYTVSTAGPDMWRQHGVIGLSFVGKASEAQLAALSAGPSADVAAAGEALKSVLRDRCTAAIEASGAPGANAALTETATPMGAGRYAFQFKHDGGEFVCQVCNEDDASVSCSALGLQLSHSASGGASETLPADYDRKCVFSLQSEVKDHDDGQFLDREVIARITTEAQHTDARWVYAMALDGDEYRCVIRKSDREYSLQRNDGGEWTDIGAGRMY